MKKRKKIRASMTVREALLADTMTGLHRDVGTLGGGRWIMASVKCVRDGNTGGWRSAKGWAVYRLGRGNRRWYSSFAAALRDFNS